MILNSSSEIALSSIALEIIPSTLFNLDSASCLIFACFEDLCFNFRLTSLHDIPTAAVPAAVMASGIANGSRIPVPAKTPLVINKHSVIEFTPISTLSRKFSALFYFLHSCFLSNTSSSNFVFNFEISESLNCELLETPPSNEGYIEGYFVTFYICIIFF